MGFAFSTVGAMVAEVGLEVIGLGPSNIVTLGLMINFANGWAAYSRGRWQMLLIPVGPGADLHGHHDDQPRHGRARQPAPADPNREISHERSVQHPPNSCSR